MPISSPGSRAPIKKSHLKPGVDNRRSFLVNLSHAHSASRDAPNCPRLSSRSRSVTKKGDGNSAAGTQAIKAEQVISLVLGDPQVRQAGEQVEAAEMGLGMELRARLQLFQDRYEQALTDGDFTTLARTCPAKHGRWGRICVLDDGPETSMEEPHWGRNGEGQPIAWVGSAPDDW